MPETPRVALIAGASGLVGSFCLQYLLADPRYRTVHSLVRRHSGEGHSRLREHLVDFERLAADMPDCAIDDVYCCLGTTMKQAGSKTAFERVDHDYVVELARLCKARGARRFMLVSALGADAGSSVFYNRVKGRVELELQQLDFPALHIFRPSLLTGPRKEFRLGERVASPLARLMRPLMRGGLARYRAVDSAHVARCMLLAAATDLAGVKIHYPSESG